MLSGFSGIILVITSTDNNFAIQSMGNRGKNLNTTTVDVVVPSGSTNHHGRICVGDGSDN
jgi:hypothetical protein